ncbi:MAG TPA: energy transducer TonB [Gemmatimonadales bacterium]
MRITLLESRKPTARPLAQGLLSTGLHVLLVAAAVQATAGAVPSVGRLVQETSLVYVPPPQATPPPAPASEPTEQIEPLQPGFQTVPSVVEVPTSIPPLELGVPFDPDDWKGIGRENGRSRSAPLPSTSRAGSETDPFAAEEVDEPVVPLYQPAPRYPPALQHVGVTGRVVARFVVDTLGVVEPESWREVSADHGSFAAAAREATLKARFRPARVGGRPVRQLVQQAIIFEMK